MMKKNILLVMPRVPYALNDWNIPPIGIAYVSASLKRNGFRVFNLNLTLENNSIEDSVRNAIELNHIDIVATGDLIVNYRVVKDIIDIAKKVHPEIITIIGGGMVTHSPNEAMKLIGKADYGIIGEGEITACELVTALENNCEISQINGIIYRKNEQLKQTTPRVEIENLDDIPWPDYEGFNYFEIARRVSTTKSITAGLTTSRSCPYCCTFCSTSGGKKYRERSLDSIFAELEYLIAKYNVDEFFLNDELFAVNADRVYAFCKRIKKYNVKWHVMLRISKHIQKSLLEEMSACGCIGVCYGLESADNTVLKSMKKGIMIDETLRVLEVTKEVDLKVRGGFIFGDTSETIETVNTTMQWIETHLELLENVSISPIVLYPGSALYQKAVDEGRIKDTIDFIKQGCPLINISDYLTEDEYKRLVHYDIPAFAAKLRNKTSIMYQRKLNERILADKKNKHYIHEFRCEKCEQLVIRKLYSSMMFQSHFVCPNCNKKYDFFPNFLYFRLFEKQITEYLMKNKFSIWGCGETLQDLYVCNSYLREKDVIIIDSNQYKQQEGFHGKNVYSPEHINQSKIETIVCCAGNINYEDLASQVKKEYSSVKTFLWIYHIGLELGGHKDEVDK